MAWGQPEPWVAGRQACPILNNSKGQLGLYTRIRVDAKKTHRHHIYTPTLQLVCVLKSNNELDRVAQDDVGGACGGHVGAGGAWCCGRLIEISSAGACLRVHIVTSTPGVTPDHRDHRCRRRPMMALWRTTDSPGEDLTVIIWPGGLTGRGTSITTTTTTTTTWTQLWTAACNNNNIQVQCV